ncbi:hypothetical protein DRO54_00400 [Candidatus Bathyarchaeota archaeon]|nr:MAG: hypothetical protein DRO54_00400 [Candidatus Bathyarchaeota archaeon]
MKRLQRVGHVLHLSSNRNLIVRAEGRLPKIGWKAVDENLKVVGEIFDIIGPVSSPYISIRPKTQNIESFVGKPVYVIVPSHEREKRKR